MTPRPRRRRVVRNIALAVGLSTLVVAFGALAGWSDPTYALSMGTGYAGLVALAVTLLLGPYNVVRQKPNPVSTYLRRDWGVWAGILAVVHFVVGVQRHFAGDWMQYFLFPDRRGPFAGLRYDPFGIANWTGLVATALLIVLLGLSNDRSLALFGAPRWKLLQRSSYVVLAGVFVHGVLYQLSSGRPVPWVLALVLVTLAVCAGQAWGFSVVRSRSSSREGA